MERRARGTNLLDTGAPYYDVYECADGRYVSVGAIEPQFYAELIEKLGLDPAALPGQNDVTRWAELRGISPRPSPSTAVTIGPGCSAAAMPA